MLVTVLTPTYNRGYIIEKLYESLKVQTNKSFEWIVVDDGSTDNTEEIFKKIKEEKLVELQYIKKENGGKHTALNVGIEKAKGEMTIIVDSDDYLSENAISRIIEESIKIYENEKFAGLSFRRIGIQSKKIIGNNLEIPVFVDTNSVDYRYKYNVKGDLAECFKTKILKEYKFPIFKNEKFVPESLVWNRIAEKYEFRFFNKEGIYFCEYLPDGYSQQFDKLRKNNPMAYKVYYLEVIRNKRTSLKRKIECVVRYLQIIFK